MLKFGIGSMIQQGVIELILRNKKFRRKDIRVCIGKVNRLSQMHIQVREIRLYIFRIAKMRRIFFKQRYFLSQFPHLPRSFFGIVHILYEQISCFIVHQGLIQPKLLLIGQLTKAVNQKRVNLIFYQFTPYLFSLFCFLL